MPDSSTFHRSHTPASMRVRSLLAATRPAPGIFGILNLTQDSFSDGGKFLDSNVACKQALQMFQDGADVVDIGAESTRPGATGCSAEEELARLLPVIRQVKMSRPDCILSVDTRKADVASEALNAGADIVNDVSGLQFDTRMARVVAEHGAGLVLTHSRGTPSDMQSAENLVYGDVAMEVNDFFERQVTYAVNAGVDHNLLMLDPGVGFAKTTAQSLELLRRIDDFRIHCLPLFYGISRKSFLGDIVGETSASERDFATAGALAWLAVKRTDFVRVHNVRAARHAMLAALAVSTVS